MLLRQVGELELLRRIREKFRITPKTDGSDIIVGIGDDAAVIAPQRERVFVTTDMMNEGVHFDLGLTAPFHLGFKLVSVNVSDIMAMGGSPRYLFLNIGMREDSDERLFWDLYEGIAAAMERYGLHLLGGDLSACKNDAVLSATVIGTGDGILTRGGAAVGDRIYVTGTTGDSACGLEVLRRLTEESKSTVKRAWVRETREDERIKDESTLSLTVDSSPVSLQWRVAGPLIERHLMPSARASSPYLPYATSMIDVSDGLFIDLCRICDESGLGARVYLERLPLSVSLKHVGQILGLDPVVLATTGGEDYELLFTAPEIPEGLNEESEVKITCIGEITERERIVVDMWGKEYHLKPEGYQHFGVT